MQPIQDAQHVSVNTGDTNIQTMFYISLESHSTEELKTSFAEDSMLEYFQLILGVLFQFVLLKRKNCQFSQKLVLTPQTPIKGSLSPLGTSFPHTNLLQLYKYDLLFLSGFLRAKIIPCLTLKAIKYLMNEQKPFINQASFFIIH